MKTFMQWAETNKHDLSFLVTDAPEGKDTVDEKTKRAGISDNYPDAYVKKQYPHKYFNPISATADSQLGGKIGS